MIKCNECQKYFEFDKYTYYSQHLKRMYVGKKCINCRFGWAKELKVKKAIKRLLTEKYPDIINEIYEEND